MNDPNDRSRRHWLAISLLVLGGVYLLTKASFETLGNFAPVMAFAFTGAVVMPKRFRIWAPLAVVLATDLILYGAQLFAHGSTLAKYALLLGAAFWGASLSSHISVLGTLGRVLVCSLGFYLVANTAAWLGTPAYAKTLAGWVQANTTGLPGFPPSLVFLRNALIADQVFSLLLLLAFNGESALKKWPILPWTPGRSALAN